MSTLSLSDLYPPATAWLLWFFFGVLGAHHFYLTPNITWGDIFTRFITANYFVIGWLSASSAVQYSSLSSNVNFSS